MINQLNLTGENIVHYRLPDVQQAIIERKFSVDAFPTYLLIGKDGRLAMDKAPDPERGNELEVMINKLLAE